MGKENEKIARKKENNFQFENGAIFTNKQLCLVQK